MNRIYRIQILVCGSLGSCMQEDAMVASALNSGLSQCAQDIADGIEEEGLFSDITAVSSPDKALFMGMVHDAACQSPLEIAVGIDSSSAFVMHKKLPKGQPVITVPLSPDEGISDNNPPSNALRHIGQDSARLVTGRPLKSV